MIRLSASALLLALAALPLRAQVSLASSEDTAAFGPLAANMTPQAQRLDLELARQAITEVHAAPFRFTPRKRFDSLFAAIEGRCGATRTRRDFALDVTLAVKALVDGHAALSFPDDYLEFYRATRRRLPLEMTLIDSALHLAEAHPADARLHRGAELVSIDGVPARELLLAYATYGPTRDALIPSTLAASVEGWRSRWLHAVLYGLREAYDVTVRDSVGAVHEVRLPGVDRDQLKLLYPRPEQQATNYLDFRDDGVAYLRIGSFDAAAVKEADGEKVAKQLPGFMEAVLAREPRALVIDVRGNGGGVEGLANTLYSYLSDSNFQVLREVVTEARGKRIDNGVDRPQRAKPFATGGPLERWLMQRRGTGGAYYRKHQSWGLYLDALPRAPRENVYRGPVYVIADGASFSATGLFARLLYLSGRATFVGEEVGAHFYDGTTQAWLDAKLPHSGLEVYVALFREATNATPGVDSAIPYGRGIPADVPVATTAADVRAGRDPQLARALALARGKS